MTTFAFAAAFVVAAGRLRGRLRLRRRPLLTFYVRLLALLLAHLSGRHLRARRAGLRRPLRRAFACRLLVLADQDLSLRLTLRFRLSALRVRLLTLRFSLRTHGRALLLREHLRLSLLSLMLRTRLHTHALALRAFDVRRACVHGFGLGRAAHRRHSDLLARGRTLSLSLLSL